MRHVDGNEDPSGAYTLARQKETEYKWRSGSYASNVTYVRVKFSDDALIAE